MATQQERPPRPLVNPSDEEIEAAKSGAQSEALYGMLQTLVGQGLARQDVQPTPAEAQAAAEQHASVSETLQAARVAALSGQTAKDVGNAAQAGSQGVGETLAVASDEIDQSRSDAEQAKADFTIKILEDPENAGEIMENFYETMKKNMSPVPVIIQGLGAVAGVIGASQGNLGALVGGQALTGIGQRLDAAQRIPWIKGAEDVIASLGMVRSAALRGPEAGDYNEFVENKKWMLRTAATSMLNPDQGDKIGEVITDSELRDEIKNIKRSTSDAELYALSVRLSQFGNANLITLLTPSYSGDLNLLGPSDYQQIFYNYLASERARRPKAGPGYSPVPEGSAPPVITEEERLEAPKGVLRQTLKGHERTPD